MADAKTITDKDLCKREDNYCSRVIYLRQSHTCLFTQNDRIPVEQFLYAVHFSSSILYVWLILMDILSFKQSLKNVCVFQIITVMFYGKE